MEYNNRKTRPFFSYPSWGRWLASHKLCLELLISHQTSPQTSSSPSSLLTKTSLLSNRSKYSFHATYQNIPSIQPSENSIHPTNQNNPFNEPIETFNRTISLHPLPSHPLLYLPSELGAERGQKGMGWEGMKGRGRGWERTRGDGVGGDWGRG